jgi:hypothetical protein
MPCERATAVRGRAMITIRYADLPEGLHAQAETRGRRTVIYLRPGLTAEERRRSLRRTRQWARMGYGPRLPGPGVALAVVRHVLGGTLADAGAAVRRHPVAVALLSGGLVTLALCYVLYVTVPITLILDPARVPVPRPGPVHGAVHPAPRPGGPVPAGHAGNDRPRETHGNRRAPPPPSSAAARSPHPASPGATAPAGRSPAATAPPAPPSGRCVRLGPLGVCLKPG